MSEKSQPKLWPTPRSSPNENRTTRPTPLQLAGKHGRYLSAEVAIASSSPPASPVSPRVALARGEAVRMTVGSGRRLLPLLPPPSRIGASLRTCAASLLSNEAWYSTVCWLRWKVSATPAGRALFQLAPSARPTDGTESGLWPTAKSHNSGIYDETDETFNARAKHSKPGTPDTLSRAVKMNETVNRQTQGSLNPAWVETLLGYPIGWTQLDGPPTAENPNTSGNHQESPPKSKTE